MFRLTWRTFSCAMGVALLAAMLTIIFIRVQTYNKLVLEIGELQAQNSLLISRLQTEQRIQSSRISSVEKEIFGPQDEEKDKKPIVIGAQSWQKNRDQELRRRIRALEDRLLALGVP